MIKYIFRKKVTKLTEPLFTDFDKTGNKTLPFSTYVTTEHNDYLTTSAY